MEKSEKDGEEKAIGGYITLLLDWEREVFGEGGEE